MANSQRRPHRGRYKGRASRERGLARIREHTLNRALERYGVRLGKKQQRRIVQQIQRHDTELLSREPRHREVHIVNVDGVELPVLYCRLTQALVSVLPQDHPLLSKRPIRLLDPRMRIALQGVSLDDF